MTNEERKMVQGMRRDLASCGLRFVAQKPYQETVEVEGQKVNLPFTNMSGLTAILFFEDGKWQYFSRFEESNLTELKVAHKVFVVS